MNNLNNLTEIFRKLPGVGQSQSRNLVYFFLNNENYRQLFINTLKEINDNFTICPICYRYLDNSENNNCSICSDLNRENKLIIVSNDFVINNLEKIKDFNFYYFVLGGKIKNYNFTKNNLRIEELRSYLNKKKFKEIILVFDFTPAGEETINYLVEEIKLMNFKEPISILGRGISFGTEIIYSDLETIKNSIKNRKEL